MIGSVDYHWLMRQAIGIACQAKVIGEPPFAALVAHIESGEILASSTDMVNTYNNKAAHAEVLAIKESATYIGDWRLEGCAMFVTLEPCAMCCGAMWLSRIEHCVFGAHDHKSGFLGSVHDFTTHTQMNHHYTFESGILEEECVTLLQDFFREVRAKKKALRKDNNHS